MAKKPAAAKAAPKPRPSAHQKAKAEIIELKKKIVSLNVKLDDNVVTQEELKVLKVYKGVAIATTCILIVALLKALF